MSRILKDTKAPDRKKSSLFQYICESVSLSFLEGILRLSDTDYILYISCLQGVVSKKEWYGIRLEQLRLLYLFQMTFWSQTK